jgi:hypothetical protein
MDFGFRVSGFWIRVSGFGLRRYRQGLRLIRNVSGPWMLKAQIQCVIQLQRLKDGVGFRDSDLVFRNQGMKEVYIPTRAEPLSFRAIIKIAL